MRQLISFSKFLALPKEIQEQLSTFDNAYITEELTSTAHKKKMLELERKLKSHDWYYSFGDHPAWKRGKKEEEEIRRMVDALGDDGMELYRMMGKKAGVMEGHSTNTNEDVSNKMKTAKLKELERKLKSWDYKYVHTTKSNGYKKGVAQEQEIIKLYKELGAEGLEMYRSFLKSKGMKEAKKDPIPSEYEIHLNKVMKSWGITSPDQLKDDESGNEALKRFWQEVDDTFEGSNEVQVNLPESIFPEMNTVQRQGTLGYGDDRKVGEQSLTASTFCDAGNLYENHPTWQPPSPQRKRGWQDK